MFGISLAKIVVLALIVFAVLYGSRLVQRFQTLRSAEEARRARADARARAGARAPGASGGIEEMVKCRVCGAYVAARGAAGCGQPNCPYMSR